MTQIEYGAHQKGANFGAFASWRSGGRWASFVLMVSCFGACSPTSKSPPPSEQQPVDAPANNGGRTPVVMVAPAAFSAMSDVMTYPARVNSKVQANVQAESDGVVIKIMAPLGRTVRRGEAVLSLKNTDPVYEYVPITVKAPVPGVISAWNVTQGAHVTKGQLLATITDPAQPRIVIEVPASDLAKVQPGLGGTFSLSNTPPGAEPLRVRVEGVSPLVDPATGTASVELVLAAGGDKAAKVPLGVVGKVSFALNPRRAILLPEQAIVLRGNKSFVRVVDGNVARLVPVEVAATHKGVSEVKAGLAEGAQVILRASGFVADGQPVSVKAADVATP